jgi:hypothetical protein
MRAVLIFLLLFGLCVTARAAEAVTGRVVKVLPLFLDQQGRTSLSPSLFDRDAYQARLRTHTNQVSAIRYDVLWSAKSAGETNLTIRVELRGINATNRLPEFKTLETPATTGFFGNWTGLTLAGDEYQNFGSVTAWRATLWDGDQLLGEEKSFLW